MLQLKVLRLNNNFFMTLKNIFKFLIAIIVCQLAGVIGAIFTVSAIPNWYADLIKPGLTPPNWIFGPVWTALYCLMGIAVFLVWQKRTAAKQNKENKTALLLFGIQLALNASWPIIFFGLKNPGLAFGILIALWLSLVLTSLAFYKINRLAAWLLAPCILWISFAGYLNYSLWQLNANANALIRVFSPQANEKIVSPLLVQGEARGYWYFEASFPIKLLDSEGDLIALTAAQAQAEWMTEEFVPFKAQMEFTAPDSKTGTLVLEKDNPSGLEENNNEIRIPILFQ